MHHGAVDTPLIEATNEGGGCFVPGAIYDPRRGETLFFPTFPVLINHGLIYVVKPFYIAIKGGGEDYFGQGTAMDPDVSPLLFLLLVKPN